MLGRCGKLFYNLLLIYGKSPSGLIYATDINSGVAYLGVVPTMGIPGISLAVKTRAGPPDYE